MILPPTSEISHHHKVTNITMSPTSLSPKQTGVFKIRTSLGKTSDFLGQKFLSTLHMGHMIWVVTVMILCDYWITGHLWFFTYHYVTYFVMELNFGEYISLEYLPCCINDDLSMVSLWNPSIIFIPVKPGGEPILPKQALSKSR